MSLLFFMIGMNKPPIVQKFDLMKKIFKLDFMDEKTKQPKIAIQFSSNLKNI